jgi:hypothetical protein
MASGKHLPFLSFGPSFFGLLVVQCWSHQHFWLMGQLLQLKELEELVKQFEKALAARW